MVLLVVIKLIFKKFVDTNYAVMYIQNFVLIFWCIALYPILMSKGKIIAKIFMVCLLALSIFILSLVAPREYIIDEEYYKLHEGITYDEAVKIIGSDGTKIHSYSEGDYNTVIYKWNYKSKNDYVSVIFINDKLETKEKYTFE